MSATSAYDAPSRLFAACHAIARAANQETVWATTEHELSPLTTASICMLVVAENRSLIPLLANPAIPGPLPHTLDLAWDGGERAGFLALDNGRICAAPCLANGRLIGAIALVSETEQPLASADQMLLAAIAASTGQALAAFEHRAEMRASLARSLHDGPVQDLATAQMMLEHLLQTDVIAGSSRSSLTVRSLAQAASGLRRFIASLHSEALVAVAPDARLPTNQLFPDISQEEELLAVTREALRNIRKHANAQSIQIALQRSLSEIAVKIQDDGAGFNGEEKPGHFGLAQMRGQAARAGASLQVDSTRQSGTSVLLIARQADEPAPLATITMDAADE